MRNNTGNPVPSSDPRDRQDNSLALDEAVNSESTTFNDRTGKSRLTIKGMEQVFDGGQPAIDAYYAAIEEADRSSSEADRSQAAADAAQLSSGIYETTSEGIAATVDGDYFSVPAGDTDFFLILYLNDAGIATEIRKYPSTNSFPSSYQKSDRVALFQDEDGNVPLWLENGNLAATGVTGELQAEITEEIATPPATQKDAYVALFTDDVGNVPLWLEDGKLNATDVHEDFRGKVFFSGSQTPLATDARSLYRVKAKIARLEVGGALTKLKLMFTGDSWTDFNTIPEKFLSELSAKYGLTATGWVSLASSFTLNSVSVTFTGFTKLDETANAQGPDIYALEGTGTTETASVSNLVAESIDIYYKDLDGTFRYRIDGGSWVEVVGSNTGDILKVSLTGLSDATHTVDIDTSTNAGTVRLFGLYSQRNASGVEISKVGNAGAKASDFAAFSSTTSSYLPDLDPDIVFIVLGTNDGAASVPAIDFKSDIQTLVSDYTAAAPQASIILVAPPHNGLSSESDMEGYRDALYEIASENAMVESLNLYDMASNYTTMNNSEFDIWQNQNHLNSFGGKWFFDAAEKYFL